MRPSRFQRPHATVVRTCCHKPQDNHLPRQDLKRSLHRNQQYSITAVSDGGGSVVERYAYSAYGQVTIADGSGTVISDSANANRYTYTGREWDEGLNLYHYRARMYDPVGGRFVSPDPIGFEGESASHYLYVLGRPAVLVDPTGEIFQPTEIDKQIPKNSPTPSLGIEVQTVSTTTQSCGRFSWTIRFLKKLPLRPGGSFVYQIATGTAVVKDCSGNLIPGKQWNAQTYEAWPIPPSTPITLPPLPPGTPSPPQLKEYMLVGFDTFTFAGGGNCTQGTVKMDAEYTEIFGKIPGSMPPGGNSPPSGPTQPASPTDPGIKPHAKMRKHVLEASWNCCGCNCKGDPSYDPNADPRL